jgi:hypothetical protein
MRKRAQAIIKAVIDRHHPSRKASRIFTPVVSS